MKTKLKLLTFTISCALLTACGSSSNVTEQGTTDAPVFPKIDASAFNHDGSQFGSWVNWDNMRQIKRGINKDQLYNLIGRPHYLEGFYGVREWDYVFNYHENGVHKICQYKVLFDINMNAQSFLWYPNGCNSDHNFNLNSDFLFKFDKSTLTEEGQKVIVSLANKLNELKVKKATIEGYTDRIGSDAYNLALSKRRAETVKNELHRLGVNADFEVVGYGKANQVKSCEGNDMEAKKCLMPNRRVVVKVNKEDIAVEQSTGSVAGNVGPAPLYNDKYPYDNHINGNTYPVTIK